MTENPDAAAGAPSHPNPPATSNAVSTLAAAFQPSGDAHLRRRIGAGGLTLLSLGSIIGSGWLLSASNAASIAGPASILSWLLGSAVLMLLALVHAELGSACPVSGGPARFPYLAFGAFGALTGGWYAWLQAVTVVPIEIEASLGYLNSQFPSLGLLHTSGTLTGRGILAGIVSMLVFSVVNTLGVQWLARTNSVATIWKVLIPGVTIIALTITDFHTANFTAGGGFAPFGFHGVFAALPLGIIFSLGGFEQAVQLGGEARHPQRDIPRAVIGSMLIGAVLYLLLEVAFIGALNPAHLVHGWSDPIPGVGALGPYATLATDAGMGWLSTILVIDAVISPAGAGLAYFGGATRLSYAMAKDGFLPSAVAKINGSGVPIVSILVAFAVGVLTFLPFPSWSGLVGLISSAAVLMYAMAPVALGSLRLRDPDRARPYRLPLARILSPMAFVLANLLVYFAGWSTIFWVYTFGAVGLAVFALNRFRLPPQRRPHVEWRSAQWIMPWLAGLALISWQGRYVSAPSTVFGITLNPQNHIPNWWDLAIVAAFSIIIYTWAVAVSVSSAKVRAAIAELAAEAVVD